MSDTTDRFYSPAEEGVIGGGSIGGAHIAYSMNVHGGSYHPPPCKQNVDTVAINIGNGNTSIEIKIMCLS